MTITHPTYAPTPETRRVIISIGKGLKLRVPHDGSGAHMVPDPRYGASATAVPHAVDDATIERLVATGVLHKLAEHQVDQRIGWREAGMDGDVADWYVLTQ